MPPPKRGDQLIDMEMAVLEEIARGRSQYAAARRLCISRMSVTRLFQSIRVKLGARSNVHAMMLALKEFPELREFVTPREPKEPLTPRMRRYLLYVARGWGTPYIARREKVTKWAVYWMIEQARTRMGILGPATGGNDRLWLAIQAWQFGQVNLKDVKPVRVGREKVL